MKAWGKLSQALKAKRGESTAVEGGRLLQTLEALPALDAPVAKRLRPPQPIHVRARAKLQLFTLRRRGVSLSSRALQSGAAFTR